MRDIEFYFLEYQLDAQGGPLGVITIKFKGDPRKLVLKLEPGDFVAASAVLTQKRIAYDPKNRIFLSADNDDEDEIQDNTRRA